MASDSELEDELEDYNSAPSKSLVAKFIVKLVEQFSEVYYSEEEYYIVR